VTAPLLPEHGKRRARAEERPHEVDVHHPPHDVDRRILDRPVVSEPGVADDYVERAERQSRGVDEPIDVRLDRDVHRHRLDAAARSADFRGRLLEPIDAPCAKHDGDPFTRKRLRACKADPRRCTRNRRDAALEGHEGMIT
jgi:hypothetical protein